MIPPLFFAYAKSAPLHWKLDLGIENIYTMATFLQTHTQPDSLVRLIDDNLVFTRTHIILILRRYYTIFRE